MSKNLANMSKKVLAVLSAGSEEMEFTITVDILRRAGVSCAGVRPNLITPVDLHTDHSISY